MLHAHHATGLCKVCGEGRFVLDATLKTPWHRRLKPGVAPIAEHLTTDFEVCPGVGELATAVETADKSKGGK